MYNFFYNVITTGLAIVVWALVGAAGLMLVWNFVMNGFAGLGPIKFTHAWGLFMIFGGFIQIGTYMVRSTLHTLE